MAPTHARSHNSDAATTAVPTDITGALSSYYSMCQVPVRLLAQDSMTRWVPLAEEADGTETHRPDAAFLSSTGIRPADTTDISGIRDVFVRPPLGKTGRVRKAERGARSAERVRHSGTPGACRGRWASRGLA